MIAPLGHAAIAAVCVPLFAHLATVGSALLFYGASMLVGPLGARAAVR